VQLRLALLLGGLGLFGLFYYYGVQLAEWLRFRSLGTRDYLVEMLGLMFIETTPQKVLMGMVLCAVVPGVLVFLALAPNWIPALVLGAIFSGIGVLLPRPIVDYLYQRRCQQFVLQMVDALSLMSNGLKSGLSVVQSLGLVSQEMPNPIQQEFNLILSENKVGVSLEDAFLNLSRRVKAEDVEMFVTAVNILKETGGNLAETFDTIVFTIRERIKAENKISALTAQGFYQGVVVALIPIFLGGTLYNSDPELMSPLFTDPRGWGIMAAIALLDIVGFMVILRVVKVDV
jgi:tight adherence protein B